MSARIAKADVQPPDRDGIQARYEEEGLRPYAWSNGPDDRYGWHTHGYTKVLYCVSGSIVFHTREGDFELTPGDRLEVDPGTEHAATVGSDGVVCLEAAAR
jgi:quercetin dioxygenase-like cupin family protein